MTAPHTAPDAPLTVLIVDDQAMIAEAVRRMLASQADLSLVACTKGAEALERAVALNPDVILQDLVMPDAEGLDLVRAYREHSALARTPLIVLSTKEEATTKAEAFARGANDYLVKLPDPIELVARIRYHARVNRAQNERDRAFAALRAELESAAGYVRRLIPAPVDGAVATRWAFIPSASLGGDAFGYRWIDDNRFAIYLLDVCGHGVGPALLGVSVMNALSTGALTGADAADPGAVLTALNELYPMSKHNGMFFTIWYGVVSLKERELRYACGGHPPAILSFAGGEQRLLGGEEEVSGPVIGAVKGLTYDTGVAALPPGSQLLVYSDGVHEVAGLDGVVRGIEEFLDAAKGDLSREGTPAVGASTSQTVDDLLRRARSIMGRDEFDDDVSLLHITVP